MFQKFSPSLDLFFVSISSANTWKGFAQLVCIHVPHVKFSKHITQHPDLFLYFWLTQRCLRALWCLAFIVVSMPSGEAHMTTNPHSIFGLNCISKIIKTSDRLRNLFVLSFYPINSRLLNMLHVILTFFTYFLRSPGSLWLFGFNQRYENV